MTCAGFPFGRGTLPLEQCELGRGGGRGGGAAGGGGRRGHELHHGGLLSPSKNQQEAQSQE